MSNRIYGYGGSGGYSLRGGSYVSDGGTARYGAPDPHASSGTASVYSSLYSNQVDRLRPPGSGFPGAGGFTTSSITGGVGMKRPSEALYHQTIVGSHTIGQNEALFPTNYLAKYPRLENSSNLPIYPQRRGERDCAHYMLTRTCKFGNACKFDHPVWVPEGGIPNWKEIPFTPTIESLPERPGEPDCPYYMNTQKCKFGFRCKFNHPKDKLNAYAGGEGTEFTDNSVLPERPSEPTCSFYAKTGKCKFGASCKFHHPKDIQIPSAGQDIGSAEHTGSGVKDNDKAGGDSKPTKTFVPFTPALFHNSKGLPIRLGEPDCPFYLKTGSCKYATTCRYNHPDRNAINPPVVTALGHSVMPSTSANLPISVLSTAASILPNIDQRLAQASIGVSPKNHPQRPGQIECDFYMKTGQCSFGERCKFHHPIDRLAPTSTGKQASVQNVKLTLAGLPRREGSVACPFYMKTSTCNYGATCRYDHPPPGEAIAMATAQGTGTTTAGAAGEEMVSVEPSQELQ